MRALKKLLLASLMVPLFLILGASPSLALFDGWRECSDSGSFYISENSAVIGLTCKGEANIPFGATSVYVSFQGAPAGLTSINIPSSVKSVGLWPSPPMLSTINVDSNNRWYSSVSGVLFDKKKANLLMYPRSKSGSSYTIPASVSSIGDSAFSGSKRLKTISFAKGSKIKSIEDRAFSNAGSVQKINIPDSVLTIGVGAFEGSKNLHSVTFGTKSKLKSVGARFLASTDVVEIVIPSSVTSIDEYAFYDSRWLQSISVKSNNKKYSSASGVLFNKNKTKLITYPSSRSDYAYTIPASIVSINKDAFYRSTQLLSISFSKDSIIKSVSLCALSNQNSLEKLSLPASVTSLKDSGACPNADNLQAISVHPNNRNYTGVSGVLFNKKKDTILYHPKGKSNASYTIPSGVKTIGGSAFWKSDLSSISIPSSVTTIEGTAFAYTIRLKTVVFASGSKLVTIEDSAFLDATALTSITIPANVKSIGSSAFQGTKGLRSVIFAPGSKLTTIGASAFSDATALTSITIPANVKSIGSSAFQRAQRLKSFYFLGNAPTVGGYAFDSIANGSQIFVSYLSTGFGSETTWKKLKLQRIMQCSSSGHISIEGQIVVSNEKCHGSVTIPASVTSIGASAFASSALTSVTIPANLKSIGSSAFRGTQGLKSVIFAPGSQLTTIGASAFASSALTSVTIPANLKSIDSSAFQGTQGLKSVIFAPGSKLTTIGASAFSDATALTSITVPEGVIGIGNSAFEGATSLKLVTFAPASQLASIEDSAFFATTALTSITIPASVTSIGYDAFAYTYSLKVVTFAPGSQLTSIGDTSFDSSALTSITIPASVTSIGSYAFAFTASLKDVTFAPGSQLTSIGSYAFADATGLTSITFPEGVIRIGNSAFEGATRLVSFIFLGNEPTNVDDWSFYGVATGAKAIIKSEAEGFGNAGSMWHRLVVSIES